MIFYNENTFCGYKKKAEASICKYIHTKYFCNSAEESYGRPEFDFAKA